MTCAREFTKDALSELIGMTQAPVCRYESDTSQPTLDVINTLAIRVSAQTNELIFEGGERKPDNCVLLLLDGIGGWTPTRRTSSRRS